MLHTPRLCIDGRAAAQYPVRGLLAAELIDQLVAALGEKKGPGEWVERQRTVLINHPRQIFAGQLRAFNTRRRIGRSPLYGIWEKYFVKNAHISAFHRFRPADRLGLAHELQTINTVLPPEGKLPRKVPCGVNDRFVVPSPADAERLKAYGIPENQISVFTPGVRRSVHFQEGPRPGEKGKILVIGGDPRFAKAIGGRHPSLAVETLKAEKLPGHWRDSLAGASLVLYLETKPFDWATLPLEAIRWKVPVVFSDDNATLAGLLPSSPFKLSRFLVDPPKPADWTSLAEKDSAALAERGVYEPLAMAYQYAEVYDRLLPVVT